MPFTPIKDRTYLDSHSYQYEEAEEGGQKALILKNYVLPDNKYDVKTSDVLILLPSGYPDTPPDMFYLNPWVKLLKTARYPNAADQPVIFSNIRWQRWSRHSSEWRAGKDGIWTMLKRIKHAIEVAE